MNTVHIVKVKNLEKNVKNLINNLGINKLKKGSKIFIKINLSLDRDYPGTCTSPDILKILVSELSKRYEVSAGDADSTSNKADLALKVTSTGQAIKEGGGKVINMSKDAKVLVKNRRCKTLKKHLMPKTLIEADAVISLALLKTHVFTKTTSSLKNLFGCLPDLKILHHQHLDESIHDAVIMSKPTYGIIDGRIGMEGRGPVEGTPINVGVIMGSNNLVSLDAEAAKIMGFKPEEIEHIVLCDKTLGGLKYTLKGPRVRKNFKPATPGFIDRIQSLSFKNKASIYLCYKTPLFKAIKAGAKTLKDIGRYFRHGKNKRMGVERGETPSKDIGGYFRVK